MHVVTKQLFSAIAEVLPDDGHSHITRLDLRHGWGDILHVRIHTPMSRSEAGRHFAELLREAVDSALADERHSVEIVWGVL